MSAEIDILVSQFGHACLQANAGQEAGVQQQAVLLAQMSVLAEQNAAPLEKFSHAAAILDVVHQVADVSIRQAHEKTALGLMQDAATLLVSSCRAVPDAVLTYAAGVLSPELKQTAQQWARQLG